ncbi:hypothetical protein HRbin15_00891 [bacterium HR15]|nr:hypothetical protein HRbin15_00891 [bacterium HR15]
MVSVKLDFYRYREEVRRAILQQIARLDSEWDPFVASWLAYACSQEGFESNKPLFDLIERLRLWAEKDEVWAVRRNLGALCFLGYFLRKMGEESPDFTNRLLEQIEGLERDESPKFSPKNDPEQVFPMALLVGMLDEAPQSIKDFLKKVAQERIQGPLKRQILYLAAWRELDETVSPPTSILDVDDPGDAISLVWFWERYEVSGQRAKWWKTFESVRGCLSFEQQAADESARIISPSEMALLYEALTRETDKPDPNLLFELYPLHPRVKEIARKPFQEGNYVHAVLEAAKAFEKYLKELTQIDENCRRLVQESFKVQSPRIRFNKLQSRSEKSEQEGLRLIAEGICAAVRNPKGHEPMDAPAMQQLDAFEALDQLAIISYIFKRVEKADVINKDD